MTPKSLRVRITLGMFLLALSTGALLSVGVYLASEELEETVLARILEQEVRHIEASTDAGPSYSALLRVYRADDEPPAGFAGLSAGRHHAVEFDGRLHEVFVGGTGTERVYVAYDITDWEHKERDILRLLVIGVAAITLLGIPFAYWASQQIAAPVTALAGRVARRDPGGPAESLAEDFRGQELEPIARAVDDYTRRIDGFVEREQLFTRAASHELRTPLSVLTGALEIIEEERLSDRGRRGVARMSRAVREMSEYIDALLLIAREGRNEAEDVRTDVADVVRRVAEDQRNLTGCSAPLAVEFDHSLQVQAPPSMLAIVVGNLLHNALLHTGPEGVVVRLRGRVLEILDSGPGIAPELRARVFERGFTTRPGGIGMGLFLARQICERYGWRLALEFPAAGGTLARVEFVAGLAVASAWSEA